MGIGAIYYSGQSDWKCIIADIVWHHKMEDTACVVLDTTDDEELKKLIESEEEDSENVIQPEEEDELSRVGWQVLTLIKVIAGL